MTIMGQVIGGHYALIRKLGEGSFGKTYIAEDLHARKRQVVVKQFCCVCKNQTTFHKAKELFDRESEVLYKLSNSVQNIKIPKFIAFFEENQNFYLVEEMITGLTLREELAQKTRFTEDEVRFILENGLKILHLLHEQGIIHRDIKPDNIILRESDRQPILIDYGAVKEITQVVNTNIQTKSTIIYTAGYSPQEQLKGEVKFNSDIYALGMTAIEVLTGLEPKNLTDNWYDQISVSNSLVEILQKMVHEDYRHRYQSVEDVLIDLSYTQNTWMIAPHNPLTANSIPTTFSKTKNILPQLLNGAVLTRLSIVILGTVTFFIVRELMTAIHKNNSFQSPDKIEKITPEIELTPDNSLNTNTGKKNSEPCPPILAPGQQCDQ
jgi:serine/threonine protein kinase